jgi:hypothetical protein
MNMKLNYLTGLLLLSALSGFTRTSYAAGACGRTASSSQFDSFYAPLWGCQQARIDDMINRFNFDKGDWDGGMGWEDKCNDALPLKRTFNALQLMAYGFTTSPTCSTSSSNVGLWAYCWAGNSFDELDAVCSNFARAYTVAAPIVDNYTELYTSFFYDETVVQRAGTLFHEARHADGWCQHTSECPDGGESCDPDYSNGCVGVGSGSGRGANGYTVAFMMWFANAARASWTNTTIRADAVAEGNRYLSRRFDTDPCFRLNSNGTTFRTC